MEIASPPSRAWSRLSSAVTASQASALRLETTTRAPARQKPAAIAFPMPLVEPVTTAT